MQDPSALLAALPLDTRVVVRRRVADGFSDSLGDLVARDETTCTVRTRRGDDVVLLADVTAAKAVPPPPPRRAPRRGGTPGNL
ncbi:ferrous iron transport protein A [Arthrobacter sedimenti]|uniref:ferrous iron transport protein A n=1 Tax=Arthrobacter sedimenti TaxID=2694931 RepID=UPI000B34F175|nr:ferrous iron transport protein A [Arthrobacter sedimenti]OUM39898.1 ferrous iron transport protein A [Arthrobacter agilis]